MMANKKIQEWINSISCGQEIIVASSLRKIHPVLIKLSATFQK